MVFFNVGANFPDYVVCRSYIENLAWGSSWIYGRICANHVNDRFVGVLKVALISAIHATGDIRKFQIYEGTFC